MFSKNVLQAQKVMVFKIILISLSAHDRGRSFLYFKLHLPLGTCVQCMDMLCYSKHLPPSHVLTLTGPARKNVSKKGDKDHCF